MTMNDIEQLRKHIDDIDEEIVKNIGERISIVKKIGELKKAADQEVQDPNREAKLLLRMNELSHTYGVPLEIVLHIFDYMMTESRKMQNQ